MTDIVQGLAFENVHGMNMEDLKPGVVVYPQEAETIYSWVMDVFYTIELPSPLTLKPIDSPENHTGDPPHPPAGEIRAPAAAVAEGARSQNNVPSGTFFGLNRSQLHSWGIGATPRNYKARYPPDPHGKEMSDIARIRSIYLDQAADFDANMLAEWQDTIDVLLVFASLFSAVLTTFVVQTSQNMQPDFNEASMLLLFEILKATTLNGSKISIPSSPTDFFSPDHSDEWMNSLWFVSLTLSLITALVAILVKQWLHQYVAIVSDSSACNRARIRHMWYAGLQTWQVPMIIGLLPVLLHVSLALFFAGLAIFIFSLGMKVAWLISIIGAATYMAYVIALILPLIHPYCPYKVPLTLYIHHLYALFQYGNEDDHTRLEWAGQELNTQDDSNPFSSKFPTLKEIEDKHIQQYDKMVDVQSLIWLHSSTSDASVHQSVLQAISGMRFDTLKYLPDKYVEDFLRSLHEQIEHIKSLVLSPGADSELDESLKLYRRALEVLYTHSMDERSNRQIIDLLSSIRLGPVYEAV
ncbi:uncharacterized protein ARMOST_02703 [Armillaria ostoyae]|uniref:DUF6535 domain-containing protein n=1 Tax=Armillaria ostoyae TaxID=47428 RepID=A0A284QSG2_ARMOS|nr:uncharacterized protein ARMOST_02703 [Armillaria ostoyae]